MSERPQPAEAPRAIVAGHGDFAAGLVSAVEQITGRGDAARSPIAGAEARAPRTSRRCCASRCSRTGVRVIFTDLQAGSCTMAARRILREMRGRRARRRRQSADAARFRAVTDATIAAEAARARRRARPRRDHRRTEAPT